MVALRLGSTYKTMVRVWVAWWVGRPMWFPCYTRAVSEFSLLSCVTACCVFERLTRHNKGSLLFISKSRLYYH